MDYNKHREWYLGEILYILVGIGAVVLVLLFLISLIITPLTVEGAQAPYFDSNTYEWVFPPSKYSYCDCSYCEGGLEETNESIEEVNRDIRKLNKRIDKQGCFISSIVGNP